MKNKLKINFLYSSAYQVLLIILPLITAPYVSRVLGSNGLGIYSYTFSIASCFSMFGMLGVANYGNRIVAANRDDRNKISQIFFDIWMVQIGMTCVTISAYVVYIVFFAGSTYRDALLIQVLTLLCSSADISWFFFGLEEFKLTVIRNLIIKLITTLAVFIFVKTNNDVLIYTFILCAGTLLGNISLFPFLKEYIVFIKPSLGRIKKHLPSIFVLFIPVLAVTLYKKMDKIMLGMMSTMSQTGYYENAEKIINIPMGVITALGTVMMPRISYLINKGKDSEIEHYMNISIEFTFFLASSLMFGISAVSSEFVPLFYGVGYIPVIEIMNILSVTILFISLANIFRAQYLIPKHYDKIYIFSVWIGALINLILNYILIPLHDAVGASYATVIAEFSVMGVQMICIRKELPIMKYIKQGLYYLFAGGVMFGMVRIVSRQMNGWKGVLFEIFVGAVVYFMLCFPYIYLKHKKYVCEILKRI